MKNLKIFLPIFLFSIGVNAQNIEKLNHSVKDKKMEDLVVNIYAEKNAKDFDENYALVFVKSPKNEVPYAFRVLYSQKKDLDQIVSLEDFDFDNEKEIVIAHFMGSDMLGKYIYSKSDGTEKKLFSEKTPFDEAEDYEKTNYIHIARGDYEIDKNEKTIKITSSGGATVNTTRIYKLKDNDSGGKELKLVELNQTNY